MKKRALSLALAFCLCFMLLPVPALAGDTAGTTLRLVEHSGTVTIKNASGKAVTPRDEMRLYNGYAIETGAKGSAHISLDGEKAVRLDAATKVEVKKSGKQLEVALTAGQLFFSVDSPLKTDESFSIRTSTMATGIRGSFGWINLRETGLIHGHAFVTCANPVSGETRETELTGGQAVRYLPEDETHVDPSLREIDFDKLPMKNEDIPAIAAEEIAADPEKQEQIERDVPALDVREIIETAPEKRAEEDAAAEREQREAGAALAAQAEELAKREQDYYAFAGEEPQPAVGVPTGLTSVTIEGDGDDSGYTPPAPQTYAVTLTASAMGGTAALDKTSAAAGETVTLTLAPATNYRLASLTVTDADSNSVTTSGTGSTRTFTMPASNVTVTPAWELITYTVTYAANGGSGTMANGTATSGVPFTLPACGYTEPANTVFKGWRVGGEKYAAGDTCEITGDTTVTPIFASTQVWYELSDNSQTLTFYGAQTKPDSLTDADKVGTYSFGGSSAPWGTAVTTVIFAEDIIPNATDLWFFNCTGLTTITGLDRLYGSIGSSAFNGCAGLTSITIPDSVTSIGENAFYDCGGLTGVTIGSGVTGIDTYAFRNCTGLTGVTIPDNVTTIGTQAFDGCTDLTSVTIGSGVDTIGDYPFLNCTSLTGITVAAGNTSYSSEGGVLFNAGKTTLIAYPGGKSGAYSIPSGVTVIKPYAFYKCAGLTSVVIPSGVTEIGNCTFQYCAGLTSVTIPSSVLNIYPSALDACNSLTDVYYTGSQAQWDAIGGTGKPSGTGITIHCDYDPNSP